MGKGAAAISEKIHVDSLSSQCVYVQTCARYNVYVHAQPMHAIMYIYIYIYMCKQARARYNVYVHVHPMHAIM